MSKKEMLLESSLLINEGLITFVAKKIIQHNLVLKDSEVYTFTQSYLQRNKITAGSSKEGKEKLKSIKGKKEKYTTKYTDKSGLPLMTIRDEKDRVRLIHFIQVKDGQEIISKITAKMMVHEMGEMMKDVEERRTGRRV
jgi:hypothetical protein